MYHNTSYMHLDYKFISLCIFLLCKYLIGNLLNLKIKMCEKCSSLEIR